MMFCGKIAEIQNRQLPARSWRFLTITRGRRIMAERKDTSLAVEFVRKLLECDEVTGVLTWKERTPDMFESGKHSAEDYCRFWNNRFSGKRAGCTLGDYRRLAIKGVFYLEHHVVWAIIYGRWPDRIDHRNGDGRDNAPKNLREASAVQNSQNLKKHVDNTSGYIGVYWEADRSKWSARISYGGRRLNLGRFDTAIEASKAYLNAKKIYHPFQPAPRESQ